MSGKPGQAHHTFTASPVSKASAGSKHANYLNAATPDCAPPDPFTGSGPYLRVVSQCGFTAAIGYVSVPCGASYFGPGEGGTLYFELLGKAGSRGSLTEFGLQYNNDQSVQPYERGPSGYQTGQLSYQQKYVCGQTVGLMHGITPGGQYKYGAAGLPQYSPSTTYLSPNAVTWYTGTWNFFNAEDAYRNPGLDPAGNQSPCMDCSISKVTSIAQNSNAPSPSNAYFGTSGLGNGRRAVIHWEQVGFGEIFYPCTTTSSGAICGVKYLLDPAKTINGYQAYPNSTVAFTGIPDQSNDPYESYDAIDLRGYSNNSQSPAIAGGDFTDPRAPLYRTNFTRVDDSLAGTTEVDYQGDYDYDGGIVPAGYVYVYHFHSVNCYRCPF